MPETLFSASNARKTVADSNWVVNHILKMVQESARRQEYCLDWDVSRVSNVELAKINKTLTELGYVTRIEEDEPGTLIIEW